MSIEDSFAQFLVERGKLLKWDTITRNEQLGIEIAYWRGWYDGRVELMNQRIAEAIVRQPEFPFK